MRRIIITGLFAVLLLVGHQSAGTALAAMYEPGWNLVGGPTGSTLEGATGSTYTLKADGTYAAQSSPYLLLSGYGYWAFFPNGGSLVVGHTFEAAPTSAIRRTFGGFTMIGNPLADKSSAVVGAKTVLTYSPSTGYTTVTDLAPGQGAFATADNDAVLVLPNTKSFAFTCSSSDAAQALDVLMPLWLQFSDQATLAASTPRIALPGVIGQMQATKRSFDALTVPACVQGTHEVGGSYMHSRVQQSIDFLAPSNAILFPGDADLANAEENLVNDEFHILEFITHRY
jgi:hypothetical protein